VYVVYARQDESTGYAHYNGGSVTLRVPHPFPRPRRLPSGWLPQPPRVDADGVALPGIFSRVAWVTEHEMLHVANWTHARMRREQHPAYKCTSPIPPAWAQGVALRVVPSERRAPALPPQEKAAARAVAARQRAEARAQKDAEALARWERKLKLANTKVKSLRRKIAARERRTNHEEKAA
jgi:hypothetical protein